MRIIFNGSIFFVILSILIGNGHSAPPPYPTAPIFPGTTDKPTTTTAKPHPKNCGYSSCPAIKEGYINVHIVPHTHDDVGWLKTVDQYFYGSKSDIQNAGVQYILDTVIGSLRKDKNRRFIYVETAFFWKWWIKQHDIVKARVRKLVNNGQLEFISGGWSMNDEAATHYHSIIDQMTWGLRKLNDTFGECGRPRIGWQIDPFGHSKEMANIFAQLGFDALLLGRIDYQDKAYRWKTRTPEVVWRASSSLGESSDIFTGVMYNVYGPPPGFCFDILCGDEPIIDDKKSFEYNVNRRVDEFLEYATNASKVYTTNNIIITMGEDFNYQDAEAWFINLDKLILYANARQVNGSKFNLLYSTPSCYVKAIHDETANNKSWLLKNDDFFPYASDPHAYWTGYFTSRPAIKRFERYGNNFLQVCKQLYALADLGPEDRIDLNALREAMGVMQHHDAVTGTEKQHVANDYARLLQRGIEECEIISNAALNKLTNGTTNSSSHNPEESVQPFYHCPLANISQCASTENLDNFVVTIYNPLSRSIDKVINIPVVGGSYNVTDSKGVAVLTQLVPIADFVINIPGRSSNATYDLYFVATAIPALGFKSYIVSKTKSKNNDYNSEETSNRISIKDTDTSFQINSLTGLITEVRVDGVSMPLTQNFFYYEGYVGDNRVFSNRSSGAYVFRPYGPIKPASNGVRFTPIIGEIIAEARQTFNEYISQSIRINRIENYIEFDWVIGPLPTNELRGREIVTRYSTNFQSNSSFYTDSNGKEMLKRRINFRPTWKLNVSEPVSGNYYPVTSKITIRDEQQHLELAVLNDRAQGGSSLNDGEIELMIHRNCLHDDAFGVGEALNETAFGKGLVIRGSHYLTFGYTDNRKAQTPAFIEKDIAQKKLLDSWTFISPLQTTPKEYQKSRIMELSGLRTALPPNVNVLTLEPWIGFSFLLRLEHVFEQNEDPTYSKSAVVKLKDLFTAFEIVSVQETTLGGNQWMKDNNRMKFNTNGTLEDLVYEDIDLNIEDSTVQKLWMEQNIRKDNVKREVIIDAEDNMENFEIVLNPSQIRTFIIDIKKV